MGKILAAESYYSVLKIFEVSILNRVWEVPDDRSRVQKLFDELWDNRFQGGRFLTPEELFDQIKPKLLSLNIAGLERVIAAHDNLFVLYGSLRPDNSSTARVDSRCIFLFRLAFLVECLHRAVTLQDWTLTRELHKEIELTAKYIKTSQPNLEVVVDFLTAFSVPIMPLSKVISVAADGDYSFTEDLKKIKGRLAAIQNMTTYDFAALIEKLDEIKSDIYSMIEKEINRFPWGKTTQEEEQEYKLRIAELNMTAQSVDNTKWRYREKQRAVGGRKGLLWIKQLSTTLRGSTDEEKRENFARDFFDFIDHCIDWQALVLKGVPIEVTPNCQRIYECFLALASRPVGQQLIMQLKRELEIRKVKIAISFGKKFAWDGRIDLDPDNIMVKDNLRIMFPELTVSFMGLGENMALIFFPEEIIIGHELTHALHYLQGLHQGFTIFSSSSAIPMQELYPPRTMVGSCADELMTIELGSISENALRKERHLPLRYSHSGAKVIPPSHDANAQKLMRDFVVKRAMRENLYADFSQGVPQAFIDFLANIAEDAEQGVIRLQRFAAIENLREVVYSRQNLEAALACGNFVVAKFLLANHTECDQLTPELLAKLWRERKTHPFFQCDIFPVEAKKIILRQLIAYAAKQLTETLQLKVSKVLAVPQDTSDLLQKLQLIFATYNKGFLGVKAFRHHISDTTAICAALSKSLVTDDEDEIKVFAMLEMVADRYEKAKQQPDFKPKGKFAQAVGKATQLMNDYVAPSKP